MLQWVGIRYYGMLDNKISTSVKKTLKSICALRDIAVKAISSVCVCVYARTFQIWAKTRLGARGVLLAWGKGSGLRSGLGSKGLRSDLGQGAF